MFNVLLYSTLVQLLLLKGYSTFFGRVKPRVKQSSFTVFESI